MIIEKIYPNPLLKNVIFQITFPNLFYIESKIGNFQIKIMEKFPKSALLLRKQILFADLGPEAKPIDIQDKLDKEIGGKVWQFKSEKGIELNITNASLSISSTSHKTYNLGDTDKFRDMISYVVDNFFSVTSIPILSRVGLRYINEGPIPNKSNSSFESHYNSILSLTKIDISKTDEYGFKAIINKDTHKLLYAEAMRKQGGQDILILDYDAYASNVPVEQCMDITDSLHNTISDQFSNSIKAPIQTYMESKKD